MLLGGLIVEHRAGQVVDLRLDRQPGLRGAAQVVERDRAVVERVQRVQRPVGLLRAEVAARLVPVEVPEEPQQARPALVHLPVDRPGRRQRGVVRVIDERLELRPGVLVVLRLCLLDVLRQGGRRPVPGIQRRVEVAERAEVVVVVAGRLVVGVVLVVRARAEQVGQLGRRHEPVQRVHGRDGVAGALLAVVAPRAAGVGLRASLSCRNAWCRTSSSAAPSRTGPPSRRRCRASGSSCTRPRR